MHKALTHVEVPYLVNPCYESIPKESGSNLNYYLRNGP